MRIRSAMMLGALTAGILMSWIPAFGYGYTTCNGTPVKWESNSANYQVMRCSIP